MNTTREQFISKMCELLEVQGYHATGLNQLIKESGSPKGSLYYHFPGGKDELTEEAIELVGGQVLERIRLNLAAVADPAEAVQLFISRISAAVVMMHYRGGGPITTVALETAATNERLRVVCDRIYTSWQGAFIEKLRSSGIDAERAQRIGLLIIAVLEGAIILARTSHTTAGLDAAGEELALLIRGA